MLTQSRRHFRPDVREHVVGLDRWSDGVKHLSAMGAIKLRGCHDVGEIEHGGLDRAARDRSETRNQRDGMAERDGRAVAA